MPLQTYEIEYFLLDSANTTRTATLLAESEEQALDMLQGQHPLGTMLSIEQID